MRLCCLLLVAASLLPARLHSFGVPACSGPGLELAHRHGFLVCYDSARKLPRFTLHRIILSPAAPARPRPAFRPDPALSGHTATPRDFTRSGFHRGHLVPAADLAGDGRAYADSFLLSNVIPQSPPVNNGIWRRVENAARRLARSSDIVLVITGVLTAAPDPERLGPRQATVPSHTFKAILALSGAHKRMFAVLVPNCPAAATLTLAEVATTVDALEAATRLDFFSALDDAEEDLLESTRAPLPGAAR